MPKMYDSRTNETVDGLPSIALVEASIAAEPTGHVVAREIDDSGVWGPVDESDRLPTDRVVYCD